MMVCKSNEGKSAITEYILEKDYYLNKDLKINFYSVNFKLVEHIK